MVRSLVENVIADGQDGTGNLWHGFHFEGADFVTVNGFQARAQQDGVRVNGVTGRGVADLMLWGGKIGQSTIGLHVAGNFGGLYVGICRAPAGALQISG